MATPVVIGGLTYFIPAIGDSNWGQNVADSIIALAGAVGGGGFFAQIVTVTTSPTTVVSARTYLVDTTAARQLNLPTPAVGVYFLVRDIIGTANSFNITIHRSGGEKIDGVASDKVLSINNGSWWMVSDGTDWFTLKDGMPPSANDVVINAGKKLYLDGVGGVGGDTYIHEASANRIEFVVGGSTRLIVQSGSVDINAADFNINSTKKLYLDGGGDSYIAETSANIIRIIAGGFTSLQCSATGFYTAGDFVVESTKKIYLDGGSNTAIFESSADNIQMYIGGAPAFDVNTTRAYARGDLWIASTNKFYLDSGGNTYLVEGAADQIHIYTGGVNVAIFRSTTTLIETDFGIESTKKFYIDGGGDTYIYESSANVMNFVTNNTSKMTITGNVNIATKALPNADNTSGQQLGDTSAYWYGLWYGSGGLNAKPCFSDLKSEVNIKRPNKLYDTLPEMGTFKRKENGVDAAMEKGFIIDDVEANKADYEYIYTDDNGLESMRIDLIVAQLSVAMKDMNSRVKILEGGV